jgi:hypothetical protein
MTRAAPPETYAKFRLAIVNDFRNEWSYVDYRRWGLMELWTGCRIREPPPLHQSAEDRISIWFNWEMVGAHKSYADAERQRDAYLKQAPVNLGELLSYLELR